MNAICLHDKEAIQAALRRSVFLNLYGLGDLDDPFWPHTTWYGWRRDNRAEAIALLYSGLKLPTFLALADDDSPAWCELIRSILHLLPARFYCHLTAELVPIASERYQLDSHGTYLKMGLTDRSKIDGVDTSATTPLGQADLDEIDRLYAASYEGHWFEPHMLASGHYVGLRDAGRLVSIAGAHVHSPRYRVAALGNIATHPDHRNRGYARAVTAALCRRLCPTTDHIGLNVKADNVAGIRCYERLGFEAVAEYEENMAQLKHGP
jgi:ribosomal protein S18 acetylase RimI-like enzyme